MLFGVNIDVYDKVSLDVGGITSVRVYNQPGNYAPPRKIPGITGIYSVKPSFIPFLRGEIDTEIIAYLKSLPDMSLVTAWHEANMPHEQREKGAPQTASEFSQVIKKLDDLAALVNHSLRIGAILGTYPVQVDGQNLAPWIPADASWIGLDGYQLTTSDTPDTVFTKSMMAIHPAYDLLITETNSRVAPVPWIERVLSFTRRLDGFAAYFNVSDYPYATPVDRRALNRVSVMCAQSGIR